MATTNGRVQSSLSEANQTIIPIPEGFSPEGVSDTLVDASTLSLIDQIIPGGREVFTHLLSYATLDLRTSIQQSLFRTTSEHKNEAIVFIKHVDILAKSPRSPFRAPDAYARRRIALETLDIIHRKSHRTCTEIRIPMGKRTIHVPSLLQALWYMHETYKDIKVKQLARKMAKRLQSEAFQTENASIDEEPFDRKLAPAMHVLDTLLQSRGIQVDSSILAETCTMIAHLLLPEKRDQIFPKVNILHTPLSPTRPFSEKVNDELNAHSVKKSKLYEIQSDHTTSLATQKDESLDKNTPNHREKVPPICVGSMKKSKREQVSVTKSPVSSPNCPNAPKVGDSFGNVSISDHHSSPHYFSQERESLIDIGDTSHSKQGEITPEAYKDSRPIEEIRRDARRYADILDGIGNYRWMGKLVACVQSYPETIRHVALIDTIFHSSSPDWRGKPRSPGAWFCKAATFFHAGGEVPQEVKCWAEIGFSYREIDDALRRGQRIPPEMSLLVNTQCAPAEIDKWIEDCHDEAVVSFSDTNLPSVC